MPIYISKALKAKKLVGLVGAANKGPEKTKLIQKKTLWYQVIKLIQVFKNK